MTTHQPNKTDSIYKMAIEIIRKKIHHFRLNIFNKFDLYIYANYGLLFPFFLLLFAVICIQEFIIESKNVCGKDVEYNK